MLSPAISPSAIGAASSPPVRPWFDPTAIVDIDFASDRVYAQGDEFGSLSAFVASAHASFVRATEKWDENPDGLFAHFGVNAPARDQKGLSIEPDATELIPRNIILGETAATGAAALAISAWQKVGGETGFAQIIDEVSVLGINTQPMRINGGDAGGYQGWRTSASIAHIAGNYTFSVALRRAPGKEATNIYLYVPVGISGAHLVASAASITSDWQIFEIPLLATSNGSVPLQIMKTAVVPNTVGVDIALPALRAGPMSSPISTIGAIATRSADELDLFLPTGEYSVSYTFDDQTTLADTINISGATAWQVPTNLPRKTIANMVIH